MKRSHLREWIWQREKRLNLPPLPTGTSSPPIAFMLRIGPWMIDNAGIHREYRSVSTDGKITKRRWGTIRRFNRP